MAMPCRYAKTYSIRTRDSSRLPHASSTHPPTSKKATRTSSKEMSRPTPLAISRYHTSLSTALPASHFAQSSSRNSRRRITTKLSTTRRYLFANSTISHRASRHIRGTRPTVPITLRIESSHGRIFRKTSTPASGFRKLISSRNADHTPNDSATSMSTRYLSSILSTINGIRAITRLSTCSTTPNIH